MAQVPIMCGGSSGPKPANENIQSLCEHVRPQVEEQTGKNYEQFTAITYAQQVVSGMNYFVKVHVGAGDHVHLRIYKQLPCNGGEISLTAMQTSKTAEDHIGFF